MEKIMNLEKYAANLCFDECLDRVGDPFVTSDESRDGDFDLWKQKSQRMARIPNFKTNSRTKYYLMMKITQVITETEEDNENIVEGGSSQKEEVIGNFYRYK